jgi:hypothetical protein
MNDRINDLYINIRLFWSEPHERFDKVLIMFILPMQLVFSLLMCVFHDNLWSKMSPRIHKLSEKCNGVMFKVIEGEGEFFFY